MMPNAAAGGGHKKIITAQLAGNRSSDGTRYAAGKGRRASHATSGPAMTSAELARSAREVRWLTNGPQRKSPQLLVPPYPPNAVWNPRPPTEGHRGGDHP